MIPRHVRPAGRRPSRQLPPETRMLGMALLWTAATFVAVVAWLVLEVAR